ncbi:RNA polymerase sigma factor [Bradymonas sediminis]|uniref:RNA polymerase sigma factor n=1 Tax=Bradymonas sediminis TaxID=1548548 RepID=A0A2Z4FQF4_9DELT|nr:RNA polymerase sigma factor [Bradymonas sediminis]AWV91122.1 RNA polymerase sigma factor [Bradymonas sediminis]TDP73678.1 RNA polymerase ECF family sigma subunit [Bradymonas sediminis]
MLLAIAKKLLRKATKSGGDAGTPKERSDEQLMLDYAGGDVAAFEELVGRHERALYFYILRSCGRRELAEEILQEVFFKVIKASDRYEPSAKFTTWVYTIARNLCVDKARKRNRVDETSLDQPAGKDADAPALVERLADPRATASGVEYERQAFREKLMAALETLPEDQREVFVLREFSGLKFQEIAEAVGCKVPTAKSRMRYALEALRGHLADYLDHSFDQEEERNVALSD